MATTAYPPPSQQYTQAAEDTSVIDDTLAPYNNSPGMTPVQLNPEPARSPKPIASHMPPSFESPPPELDPEETKSTNRSRQKALAHPGDINILQQMGMTNSHTDHFEIARSAISHPLPGPDDSPSEGRKEVAQVTQKYKESNERTQLQGPVAQMRLKSLAAGALQQVTTAAHSEQYDDDIATTARLLSIHDSISDGPPLSYDSTATPESMRGRYDDDQRMRTPRGIPTPVSGELPPLQARETTETNGHSLPSIRSTFSDFTLGPAEKDGVPRHALSPTFSQSPPYRLPPMSQSRSPPTSPQSSHQRGALLSPRSLPPTSPYYNTITGPTPPRTIEYGGARSPDNFNHETYPLPASIDRMSIDGITHPAGGYICNYSGCTAPPFQTQYLLNSHANVHSSNRPHYCPVPGCSRGEGGKGFKRKNEMIRHGLVHDSPGYICPFCPDREHKYPRPDNLQRHVRVHHTDKDKDDPLLREVLSQRPDGPNRGRRRRVMPVFLREE